MTGDRIIAGRLLEKGTRKGIPGMPVYIRELELEVATDDYGRFRFDRLPNRPLRVEVPELDYESVDALLEPGDKPQVFRLTPKPTRRYTTTIEAPTSDATRVVISMERAREIPGISGDPLKVVEVLPGLARPPGAGPNTGSIVARGSAPEDTKFYIDGLPLLEVFHFGSLYSVIQDEWISDIDFRPGGFSTEYGDAIGGFLGVGLKPIDRNGIHGHVDVNAFHAAAYITGEVDEDWAMGGAFRRSYIDAILAAVVPSDDISLTAAPNYYDYQYRADYRPNDNLNLRILWFGSRDEFSVVTNEPSDDDPDITGFSLGRMQHQLQGRLDWVINPELTFSAGLSVSYQQLQFNPGIARLNIDFFPVNSRADVEWRPVDRVTTRFGLFTSFTPFLIDALIRTPPKEGEVQQPLASYEFIESNERSLNGIIAGYAEAAWNVVDPLTLTLGVRAQGFLGNFRAFTADPRFTLRWDITETTALIAAGGLYHQAPQADESSKTFGNTELDPERSAQTSLGIKQRFGDYLTLELTGFYKYMDQLVSQTANPQSSALYESTGVGQVYGGELLARFNSQYVDGWLAYTISQSRRIDRPGEPERPFTFDQTHVLSFVIGFNPGDNWRIGARVRYSTGNPYTPLRASYYDATNDVYIATAAAGILSQRVSDFVQLDVRVDKTFFFDAWKLVLYIEIQNATNRSNIEGVGYNYDYTERDDINSLPIIPSFGIRGSW
jgi:hypothetical protein